MSVIVCCQQQGMIDRWCRDKPFFDYKFYFMTTQKQIVFTQLQAKFTQNFDTFGKMDPFLELGVGKCRAQTEVAEGAGKEPVWKKQAILVYFDETHITVKAYDQDATDNQFIGVGKIQIKGLRVPGGSLELPINSPQGEPVGTVTGKYAIKNLNPAPLLLVRSVKCEFVKQHSFLLKTMPYIRISCDDHSVVSETKDDGSGLNLSWTENMRLRIKENGKIVVSMHDKNDDNTPVFEYEAHAKQFRRLSGTKRFSVLDSTFRLLGWVEVEFETVSFVNREESVKNADRDKKLQGELTGIHVASIEANLKEQGRDVYYKLLVGNNSIGTGVIKDQKNQKTALNQRIYAESRENKLILLVWESNLIKDKVIGVGSLSLDNLSSGDKNLTLLDPQSKEEMGSVVLVLTVKQYPAKTLSLENINVSFSHDSDLIGESEPYLLVRLGGATARTETGNKNHTNFKRKLELKYSDEESMVIEMWDEDLTNDEKNFDQTIKLADLKAKGDYTLKLAKEGLGKSAKLTFRYEFKGAVQNMGETGRKQSERKIALVQQSKREEEPQSARDGAEKKKTERGRSEDRGNEDSRYHGNQNELSRNNQTINLPSIISSNNQYGDKIFDKQSAATLQRSILVYSMPKASRFGDGTKYTGQPSYCIDSCFRSNSSKGAGFGFGRKKQFPDWMERNMKDNPAPGSYFDQTSSSARIRGPTFGISHKYYERVMIPKQKKSLNQLSRKLSPINK